MHARTQGRATCLNEGAMFYEDFCETGIRLNGLRSRFTDKNPENGSRGKRKPWKDVNLRICRNAQTDDSEDIALLWFDKEK